ncbi:MAG: hypothetical protein WEE89_15095 [Gemmatimonadota bacterium]
MQVPTIWTATGPREVVYNGKSGRIRLEGHSEAAQIVWNRTVTRGAYITSADVASAARVALVGDHVARFHYAHARAGAGTRTRG